MKRSFIHDSFVILFVITIYCTTIWNVYGEQPLNYSTSNLSLGSTDGSTSINTVEYSPNGEFLGVEHQVDGFHRFKIVNSDTFEVINEMEGDFSGPIRWSPDGKYIAIKFNISKVAVMEVATFDIAYVLNPNLPELHSSQEEVRDIKWSYSGKLIAIGRGYGIGNLQIWNTSISDGPPVKILDADANASYLSFKSDDSILALGGNIENITFWDMKSLSEIRSFMVGEYNGFIDWGPNSDLLVLGGDENFHIYDFATDEYVKRNIIKEPVSHVYFALWSKNSKYLAYSFREEPYSSGNNVLRILDYNEDEIIHKDSWGENGRSISWHPDSNRYVMTNRRSVIIVQINGDRTTLGEEGIRFNLNIVMLIIAIGIFYKMNRKNRVYQ